MKHVNCFIYKYVLCVHISRIASFRNLLNKVERRHRHLSILHRERERIRSSFHILFMVPLVKKKRERKKAS